MLYEPFYTHTDAHRDARRTTPPPPACSRSPPPSFPPRCRPVSDVCFDAEQLVLHGNRTALGFADDDRRLRQ
eukprot:2189039-Prymnesium_polylepis.1